MPWRENAYLNHDATRIVCAAHGAQFDIDTGQMLAGRGLGQVLQPVAILFTTDEKVQVRLNKDQ